MSKQKEIREEAIKITKDQLFREGIRDEQRLAVAAILIVDGIFSRQSESGVVIKVDREFPKKKTIENHLSSWANWYEGQQDMIEAGYVAVEPLMEKPK